MKRIKTIFLLGLSSAMLHFSGAFAWYYYDDFCDFDCCSQQRTDFDFFAGHRWDEVTTLIKAYDPPGTEIFTDDLKIKDLSIYEIGLKGRGLYCNILVRGAASYGWVNHGKYDEDTHDIVFDTREESTAHANSGHTKDATIGIGYLFPLACNAWMGPVAGWTYHQQHFKMSDGETDDIEDSILDDLTYTTQWNGPWIGVDMLYQRCNFLFALGYEYHWAHWKASWDLDGPDISGIDGVAFSDRRKGKHGHGNHVYLDGQWNFFPCWYVGLGFKFDYWTVHNGSEHPKNGSFADVGLSNSERDKVRNASWRSYGITLDLGYTF